MRTTRFTESYIVQAIKEYEWGKKAEAICRDLGSTEGFPENSYALNY
jgi:hypothetical protein